MAAHEASHTITPESRKMADALADRGERLGEKLDSIGDSARAVYQTGKKRAEGWGEDVGTFVQEQPVKSLLIAAGVGLVLGAILTRK